MAGDSALNGIFSSGRDPGSIGEALAKSSWEKASSSPGARYMQPEAAVFQPSLRFTKKASTKELRMLSCDIKQQCVLDDLYGSGILMQFHFMVCVGLAPAIEPVIAVSDSASPGRSSNGQTTVAVSLNSKAEEVDTAKGPRHISQAEEKRQQYPLELEWLRGLDVDDARRHLMGIEGRLHTLKVQACQAKKEKSL